MFLIYPTCLSSMEEIWQCDTELSWQRKCLPEVPQRPPTVFSANLQMFVQENQKQTLIFNSIFLQQIK